MKLLSKIIAICWLGAFAACTEPSSNTSNDTPSATTDSLPADSSISASPVPAEKQRPMCKLVGSVLEGNMFWAESIERFVVISAEKETEDKELGESHRILSVYDNKCHQVYRQVLPVNLSADYPYYLSEITYNNLSRQIAIRGFDKFYILDLANLKLSAPLSPKFVNQRLVDDAQSGAIKRMELWENYLVGFAASMGPFVYDLSDPAKPISVTPIAEFPIVKGEQYTTMFLLKSANSDSEYQALAPDYDYEKDAFNLNVLFEKPLKFDPVINKSFKNNRYILLKELDGSGKATPHAVDMKERKIVELPADVQAKKDTDVLAWLKAQAK